MSRVVLAIICVTLSAMLLACGGAGQQNKNENPGQSDGSGAPSKPHVAESQPSAKSSDKPKAEPDQTGAKGDAAPEIQAVKVTAADWAAYKVARAQAEAEAEAKNQANQKAYEAIRNAYDVDRQAYDAEVERVKAAHEKQMAKFRADKEAFKKDTLAYKAAKAEFDAAGNLKVAREFYDAKKIEVAYRRFQEIIESYPKTQAAKDAKILLNGDFVAARTMPPSPARPVEPREPRVILRPPPVMPQPPQPVAVVYPLDPETAARAEAARTAEAALRAKEAKAEADRNRQEEARQRQEEEKRKRNERENLERYLVLLNDTVQARYDQQIFRITGTVANTSSLNLKFVQISFHVYDGSGAKVGSAFANISGLEAGGRWSFEALAFTGQGRQYKLEKLSGD